MAPPLTRAAVIGAARSLIATDGLEAVSLRRLAGILGVTAPALYAHVTDKQDLLRGVAELEFAQLIDAFRCLEATDPIARLRAQSRIYIERALAEPALFRTMFLFPPELELGPSTGHELPLATEAFAISLESVEAALDAGALRPGDPMVVALTLWTATHGAADVLLLGFPFDEDMANLLIDSVIDTVLTGLGAPVTVEAP